MKAKTNKQEQRRRKAIKLLKQGENYREIAQELECSLSSIHRWKEMYEQKGMKGLKPKPHTGRTSQLSLEQKQELTKLLLKGSRAHGWADEYWTLKRIALVIEKEFGVRYHPCHVWKIMVSMGWSCQKPVRVAREQDAKAIEDWRTKDWPRIKKQARGKKDGHFPRRKRLYVARCPP